ncbi:hypothetical protein [uncultured Anaerovibrio sp.]|uniref:ADP-ribosyltransferase-containing protein n=1 Tax=uncultured Anaerovibrio sp. TaxID=361586 RepID=UPI0025D05360|nr:hypothetical protein [uncultured Anaerovibrio sp.]
MVHRSTDVDIVAIEKDAKSLRGLLDNNQDVHEILHPSFNASISDLVKEINYRTIDNDVAKIKVPVDENGNPLTSKVVDENGEPLVTHHGTQKGGFSVFDPAESGYEDANKDASFFSDNKEMVESTYYYNAEEGKDTKQLYSVLNEGAKMVHRSTYNFLLPL